MRTRTFKHGVHPPESKRLTNRFPIEMIYPAEGEHLVFPVIQNIGAPCEPLVNAGDRVLMGQKIADSKAPVSVPVHSSVSGEVKGFIDTLTPSGITARAIVVENDGSYEEDSGIASHGGGERAGYERLSRDEVLAIIREAGIAGLGGAGFPTHIKLNPPKDKKIEYIIVNASECEPYLTSDHRVMVEEPDRLVSGLKIMMRMFPGAKGIIGVEMNKPDAVSILAHVVGNTPNIEIIPLKPKYPQGSEKQLIYACTGRQVPSGGLPADAGCIVNNVDTVVAVDRAVRRNRPLIRRIVTLTGGAVNRPGNYKVLIGMSCKSLISAAGGLCGRLGKVISGGPMMGVALFDLDIPIIKTSSALLCLSEREAVLPSESNCIRCGKCVEHCPISLMPLNLNQYALRNEDELFVKNHGMDCIECGGCSYICPAKRHLTQSIKSVRRRILASKKK